MKNLFASLLTITFYLFGNISLQAAEKQTLFDEFKDGGIWLLPLALFFVCFLALTIYNIIKIRKKPFLRTDIVEQIMPLVEELDFESAVALCEANPSPLTNILRSGLDRLSESDEIDPDSIEKAMAEASTSELAGPFVMVNYLNVVGSLSPMMGLLGTVVGMVGAFATMKESMDDATAMAGQIQVALLTTKYGLVVAIPSLLSYFIFKNSYGKIVAQVDEIVGKFLFVLVQSLRRSYEE
ncbi:MAG: MotA/TolQ/ExbB proton channel family protein [Opitutae bacterium]|jgi:biopolymer transport protein ExbB|nr:MotA/TolQ/ExbB proton channel family protein [Opitutae bacterium]MBT5379662.1 MotA/TolQ/ExbB proton channel family protein [Opitutae bacterium]MBT5689601.1 MotA/TolQ/ExbB proton channel family protein [Opitutae bacterium]MBT6463926.1 MotA/TolQ/ExbB proton channel family protein [Opitutae bacterium]MBT7853433.1 MotA/TolQ/ExbB proton channel family protein [Opitutae bacterium]